MIPESFDYHRPSSVDEAIGLLSDDAKLLAGGHSLIPAMKLRLSSPSALVDIGQLPELNYIREDGDAIAIGAASTHHQIESSDVVQSKASALAQAASVIGDPQVRNKGTIAADEFFVGLFLTSLAPDEIITEIRVPAADKSAYVKFPHAASRFAVVGCAAAASGGSVKIAFTGVANAAFRDEGIEGALGSDLSSDSIGAAAEKAADGAEVLTDNFAGEEYRRHLAKVYARKALSAIA